ncbi:hypothetical protein BDZ94DRAFT_1312036 [Collybia nuda]|uniref:NAD(P)-binding protein n=1 Tax=Collybia nuda TaxID=64659 RepID=A0A9P6CF19_9AGAR|nr:hypothetical protein BDZ94DRAFT_1312036 [Collybia nuda]
MAVEPKGVALVTGASKGIGRAISLRLADDGFDIALNNRSSSKEELYTLSQEINQKGRRTFITIGDVSQEEDVRCMVDATVQNLGALDVMVANAGVWGKYSPIQDINAEDWDHAFNNNTRGTFLCYKYAAQQMIKQGRGGRIIGASSLGGRKGISGMSSYCSTKFAIQGLTQSAAKDLGQHRITVNAYAPGTIETPMFETVLQNSTNRESARAARIDETCVGYLGMPLDIASLVSYLASKEAHFITGQTISANGGVYFD